MTPSFERAIGFQQEAVRSLGSLLRALPPEARLQSGWLAGTTAVVLADGCQPEHPGEVTPQTLPGPQRTSPDVIITLLPSKTEALPLHYVSLTIDSVGGAIVRATGQGENQRILQLEVTLPSPSLTTELPTLLQQAAARGAAGMLLEEPEVAQRHIAVACLDVDQTFCQGEFINRLAAKLGLAEKMRTRTAAAMRGDVADYEASVRDRVALLKGLTVTELRQVGKETQLTPGAENLIRQLKLAGIRVGLVSGGFDLFVSDLAQQFDLDFAFANRLEVIDDRLSGRLTGPLVNHETKSRVLHEQARIAGVGPEHVLAIGDGDNDRLMLQAAGLGVAFHGVPSLRAVADLSLTHHERLDVLVPLILSRIPDAEDGFDAWPLSPPTTTVPTIPSGDPPHAH